MKRKNRVAVGLSGGLDSSVAAYLLCAKGYEVIGFTLKFYPHQNRCCDLDSLYQAKRLCHKLSIPHYVIDVKDDFKGIVVKYFIDSYLKGLTPNPCVVCNQKIKFGLFPDKIKSLDIDSIATGHYAQIVKCKDRLYLRRAKDMKKTQEYFLGMIDARILNSLIFPLGEYTKGQVRSIADKEKLIFMRRGESQDTCFIGGRNYVDFIEANISNSNLYAGPIKHINGKVLGRHRGIYSFTYGQRQGLGISWQDSLYVVGIDEGSKTVSVAEKEHTLNRRFSVVSLNWFCSPANYANIKVKIRYNSKLYDCRLETNGLKAVVYLKEDAFLPTPGQLAVFYDDNKVIAGGWIEKEQPS